MKDLKAANGRIAEQWQDEKATEIEHAFIDPVEPIVRTTMLAIAELSEILDKAERACGSE